MSSSLVNGSMRFFFKKSHSLLLIHDISTDSINAVRVELQRGVRFGDSYVQSLKLSSAGCYNQLLVVDFIPSAEYLGKVAQPES